jgi:hypothetical protein
MRTLRYLSRLVVALAALAGSTVVAPAYIADNHEWDLVCSAAGYRLTSKYPVSRFIEAGVNSSATSERETLYLGRSCDAEHKVFGKGTWCWANGGFKADFERHSIDFPRQELSCPDSNDDLTGCGC